ncbi:MAG: outer membrane beta-barrel family protein, partial [Bernardetiaceae bacterium]|nr:outer membrane beta-barrel family protein [Bernardetiaceae bacterium]
QANELRATSLRDVNVKDLSNNVDVSLTYTRTYAKPQRELNVLALYSRNDRTNDFTNSILNASTREVLSRLKNLNPSLNQESTIQIDYQTPIGKTQMLEFGAKQIMRQVDSDFEYFFATGATGEYARNPNAQLSNALDYDQNVSAAYTSYTYTSKTNYSIKAGVRYEYTDIRATLQNEQRIAIPSYGALVPSINLSKKLKKGDIIKLSYNALDPEFTNNFELGYSTYIKGVALNITTFARNTNNAIQSVRDIVGRDTIRTTFQNIGREDAYGVNLSLNVNVGKLNIGTGGDLYYATLRNNVPDPLYNASNQGWVYNLRLFGGWNFGNGWGLQTFSFYRGRAVQLQGIQGGFGIYSLGVK